MDKQQVQKTIETVLDNLSEQQKIYNVAAEKDEILEVRKAIRVRIRELNEQLAHLYQRLEDLEKK